MNPMNFGGEFKIPPERNRRRVNWMPVTPEKQIHSSDPANQFPSDEWQQLTGMYGALIREPANFDGGAQNFNQIGAIRNVGCYGSNGDLAERSKVLNNIAGSYAHAFNIDRPSWNDNPTLANLMPARNTASMEQLSRAHRGTAMVNSTLRGANMAGTQMIPDLHFQADSSWRRPYASGSAIANDVNNWLSTNQLGTCNSNSNNWLSSNQLGSCNGLSQIPIDGFPLPYRPSYNLNLPPRTETHCITSIRNSVQIPATPQKEANQFENSPLSAGLNLLTNESSSKGKSLGNFVSGAEDEAIRNTCNELQNIVDSSSTAISTPLKETKELENVGDQDIDLNKTPQQKAPKRKKIRPKVVREGKPKRVPKAAGQNMDKKENQTAKRKYVRKATLQQPASQQGDVMKSPIPPTPINTDSNQKTGKRKYVRKKVRTEPATQQADDASSTIDPDAETATKTCRRGLNFDVEKSCDGDEGKARGQEEAQQNMRSFNLNLESPATGLCAGINSWIGARPAGQSSHQEGTRTSNFTPSMDNVLARYISLQGGRAADAQPTSLNGLHMENSNVSSKYSDVRNVDPWQKRSDCGHTPTHQNIHTEGIGQVVFQAKTTKESIETTRQLMSQHRAQQLLNTFPHFPEARVSKRGYQQMVQQEECYRGTEVSGSHKKTKFENGLFRNVYGMPFVKALEVPREARTRCTNEIDTSSFTSQVNHEILNSYLQNCKSPNRPSGVNCLPGDLHSNRMAAGNLRHTHELHSYTDRMGNIKGVTQVQNLASMIATESRNPSASAPPRKDSAPRKGQVKRTCQATAPADHQQIGSWKKQPPMQSKGPADPQRHPTQIEEIVNRFEGLNLKEADRTVGQEQNAMVVFKGTGAMVLHEPKKRKPRPKVDLDPETNRIWKLLMGNEGSEGIEGTEKEKWWEGEREVFRGRADSFIARMHLVQGDRRFSPWKGSVIDSVIGVFLTQNVSDHLSSSAFMCLAARFPHPKSNEAYESNGKNILVEEPEDCVVNIDDSIKSLQKISCLPVCDSSSIAPLELAEQRRGSEASGTERTSFTEVQSRSIEEEVISSQGSYDSVVQDNGGIRSSSGSNSEAEDSRNGSTYKRNSDSNPTSFQAMEKTPAFIECCSHLSESSIFDERFSHQSKQLEHMKGGTSSRLDIGDLKDSESTYPNTSQDPKIRVSVSLSNNCLSHMAPEFGVQEYTDMLNDKRTPPWSSASSEFIKTKDASCLRNFIAENVSDSNIHHMEQLRSQGQTMDTFELSNSYKMQQCISQPQPPAAYDQLLTNSYPSGGNKSYQLDNTSAAEPVKHTESVPNLKNDTIQSVPDEGSVPVMKRQEHTENKLVKPKPKEQVHSSGKAANAMNTKAKKVKGQNEGKNAADWDNLRKQAQATGKKERSKNAMDTMDYEAMRCANVREIADAIKERGMNNMLAERIKDFLNRVVRDHGSIDLEWLRDVPADKAKEYLLSIRGLGLKSVECVRLLTLHQLAFPVDTNVGRIAVRLGWVPLQPLPESLQLHLLEMYPMLESIQKYLWPRLCRLDQRTLYELHYQMITFGKVFCTKNKPNCNACPMKGECRHFASAFASARLALPGPEEKSIVTSTFPSAQEKNPTAFITPMPLLKGAGPDTGRCNSICNPIIEEPATPEQERTELSETDIEDMFDENPDEIPTINLNIETFTENLEKYVNDNMELQEGDMSKALIALNPEAASIPTPKLKNVSRLRTEHQVYELPDSHPLLAEMERREPDDPSPYLLAIWTPGETADSVEPAERKCSFQDTGKLCNDKTCFSCNSTRETNSQTVRGTILIPCRTAMRGSFPLNGTYFQVNEMFADHDSSVNPLDVPRAWIWNLPRRTVYFGTSVSTIFKGLSTEGIRYCFWRGFVCVRGFDQKLRAPRPLSSRLHYPLSRLTKQ